MKRKAERLDEILLRLGFVTEEQIQKALLRQKAHGGRLGSHLLYLKFISEDELVQALSAQHQIPGFRLDEHDISRKVVSQLPVEIAEVYQVLPIDYDETRHELKAAVVDPGDAEMVRKLKYAFGAVSVQMYVAPESLIRILTAQYYRGRVDEKEASRFAEAGDRLNGSPTIQGGSAPADGTRPNEKPRVLMISQSASLKNFLAPIFEREGVEIDIVASDDELIECTSMYRYKQVLVSQDAQEQFALFQKAHGHALANTEVSHFSSVSGAFLENPIPYHRVARSLFRSLQVIAEDRCKDYAWTPPYVLICNDIQLLGKAFGFSRLAVDGMQIAAYLLVPERPKTRKAGEGVRPEHLSFVDFDRSMDIAKSLHFPWDVQGALRAFLELMCDVAPVEDAAAHAPETALAAQILSIVWYHRVALRAVEGSPEEVAVAARPMLREQAGRLAETEVVDAYLRLLEHSSEKPAATYNHIFVVSMTDDITDQFVSRLNRTGFHAIRINSLEKARQMNDRHPPAAIIIDRESFPQKAMQASSTFKLNGIVLLYAFTREQEPSLTLDLLDAGYDDVFAPPYDFDVITARISKSLRGLMRKGTATRAGGFSASFKAFSFIDLMQTLAQGYKTVRIDLANSAGATATIYLEGGRMMNAVCGKLQGEDAIYQVIRWEDDGSFFVEPTEELPAANITDSNEGILMEGCRLLDESRV